MNENPQDIHQNIINESVSMSINDPLFVISQNENNRRNLELQQFRIYNINSISNSNRFGGIEASDRYSLGDVSTLINDQSETPPYEIITEHLDISARCIKSSGNFKAILGSNEIYISKLDEDFITSSSICPTESTIFKFEMTIINGIVILWMITGQGIVLYNSDTKKYHSLELSVNNVCAYANHGICIKDNRVIEIVIEDLDFAKVSIREYVFLSPISKITINQFKIQVLVNSSLYIKGLVKDEDLIDLGRIAENISKSYAIYDGKAHYFSGDYLYPIRGLPFRINGIMNDIAIGYINFTQYMYNLRNGHLLEMDDPYTDIELCDEDSILVLSDNVLYRYLQK